MGTAYDVIVVGAGIQGSFAAYHLAKSGKRTLLLEQFPLPHTRGSSHGPTRITRTAHGQNDFYVPMMKECFEGIRTLEIESGEKLFIPNGFMAFGKRDAPWISVSVVSMQKNGTPHTLSNISEVACNELFSKPEGFYVALDKTGGILKADKILYAVQKMCLKYGGWIHDGEKVLEIRPGVSVQVKTRNNIYRAAAIILTVGSWAQDLLRQNSIELELKALRMLVCYWKAKSNISCTADNTPTFYVDNEDDFNIYGIPSYEYPDLIKICPGDGVPINPDNRDSSDDTDLLQRLQKAVIQYFPGVEPVPSIVERCIFTMSPDYNPFIDRHPLHDNIIIGAGFSGHGFKLAPVTGKMMAQLATKEKPAYSLDPFRIDRFGKKNPSAKL